MADHCIKKSRTGKLGGKRAPVSVVRGGENPHTSTIFREKKRTASSVLR